MCGIAAIVGPCAPASLRHMLGPVVHRGPDDEGFFFDEDAALGMRRLSILDTTQLGHQPMPNADRSAWVVYNGEIYNYQQLNADLRRRGHRLVSNCDTETVTHLYDEFGTECVRHMQGMFAFTIWDRTSRTLFAARDRMGIKPLYYFWNGPILLVASELKQLIASGMVPRSLNHAAVSHYLSFGAIPAPITIWENVYALLPGHSLVFRNGRLTVEKYWEMATPARTSPVNTLSVHDAALEVRRLLQQAVSSHLISDVPLGAFLSGGIDSTTIVGLMSAITQQPVRTFCIGYEAHGERFDERQYASIAARHFHTEHQEVVVTARDLVSTLEDVVWHMDQPSYDALNSYFVSKAAAGSVKVALSGLGADELFGGYSDFKFVTLLQKMRLAQGPLSSSVGRVAAMTAEALPSRYRVQWPLRIAVGLAGGYSTLACQFAASHFLFGDAEKHHLFTPDFLAAHHPDRGAPSSTDLLSAVSLASNGADHFNQVSQFEMKFYMADVLLRDVDVMSMAHSLEVRVPFIDDKLIEFVSALPGPLKSRGFGGTKRLLKMAVADIVPPELLHRRKKGFGLPMRIWLREPELRKVVDDCLSEQSVSRRGIFEWSAIRRIKHEFYDQTQFGNSAPIWQRLWLPTVLELWSRAYLDASGS